MCFPKNFAEVFENTYFAERRKTAASEIYSKNQHSMSDKFVVLMRKC